jgi:hypothetical protein
MWASIDWKSPDSRDDCQWVVRRLKVTFQYGNCAWGSLHEIAPGVACMKLKPLGSLLITRGRYSKRINDKIKDDNKTGRLDSKELRDK